MVDDKKIVDLYWERSEDAIEKTRDKYGRYCFKVAFNILQSDRDAEECVNDTYVSAWNAIPPSRPENLATFLGKLTRNISLNRYYHDHAMKRTTNIEVALDELEDIVAEQGSFDYIAEEAVLKDLINRFLGQLPKLNRIVFVKRYWYLNSVKEISTECGISESNVKVKLTRIRKSFKSFLEKEGVEL